MEPKPGVKTTEFWITVGIMGLAAFFGAPAGTPWQARVGLLLGAVISGLGYKWSRVKVKTADGSVVEGEPLTPPTPITAPRGLVDLKLLLVIALSLSIGACATVKKYGKTVVICAEQVFAEADWNDAKDAFNVVFHFTPDAALAEANKLIEKYGAQLAVCVSQSLEQQYAKAAEPTPSSSLSGSILQSLSKPHSENARANARAFLSVQR